MTRAEQKAAYWQRYYAEHGPELRAANNQRRREQHRALIAPRQCPGCHSVFTPKHRDGTYCCRECWRRAHRPLVNARHAAANRRKTAQRREQLPWRECVVCGELFKPKRRSVAKRCSSTCRGWEWAKKHPEVGERSRMARRAREAGATLERVDPMIVLERSAWRCELCGAKTPRRFRGTSHPNAPTIDHIVPLARGGSHAYANLQTACLRCNVRKATRTLGQLRFL